MIKNFPEIVREFSEKIAESQVPMGAWYVGITSKWDQRLFIEHQVGMLGDYIVEECSSDVVARKVEEQFLRLGCKGGPGGGDAGSRWVYAYRITSSTRQ